MSVAEAVKSIAVTETTYFRWRADSGGPGRFRGGLGFVERYRTLAECMLRTNIDRTSCPPWGALGGGAGATGRVEVHRAAGGAPLLANKTDDLMLQPGDVVLVEAGGGGGYGPAIDRPAEEVAADVRRGYVSRAAAAERCGVILDANTLAIDNDATAQARSTIRARSANAKVR